MLVETTPKNRLPGNRSATLSTLLLVLILPAGQRSSAQTFDSGSDGSDGALELTEPGTIIFDPAEFDPPLDVDGDNIYHFTTFNIASGVTVRLTSRRINAPVFWLASGAVEIDGTIDLSGESGHRATGLAGDRVPAIPGSGGFSGGVGRGGGGVAGFGSGQPGGGPGGGGVRTAGCCDFPGFGGRLAGTNAFLVPLIGGSGGGGGNGGHGDGGGAGGGALLIASSESITINGSILANGGEGGAQSGRHQGGGGAGGSIRLVAPINRGNGGLLARGGGPRDRGGDGLIRLEAFEHAFGGSSGPSAIRASPFALFLPDNNAAPSLRVVSVGGVSVPPNPTGTFTMPDVTISDGSAVPIEIEARNVSPGTAVQVHLFTENFNDQIVASEPLIGTSDLSTATAMLQIPIGFSISFVRVSFER